MSVTNENTIHAIKVCTSIFARVMFRLNGNQSGLNAHRCGIPEAQSSVYNQFIECIDSIQRFLMCKLLVLHRLVLLFTNAFIDFLL